MQKLILCTMISCVSSSSQAMLKEDFGELYSFVCNRCVYFFGSEKIYKNNNDNNEIIEICIDTISTKEVKKIEPSKNLSAQIDIFNETKKEAEKSSIDKKVFDSLSDDHQKELLTKLDEDGNTLLHRICLGDTKELEWLLQKDEIEKSFKYPIDVNAKNKKGKTPLMCRFENRSLLKCKEVDINLKDNNGWTAFDYFVDTLRNPDIKCDDKNETLRFFQDRSDFNFMVTKFYKDRCSAYKESVDRCLLIIVRLNTNFYIKIDKDNKLYIALYKN